MIFTYAISPYEDWHRQAWAAGLVLLALMLVANIAARLILSAEGGPKRMNVTTEIRSIPLKPTAVCRADQAARVGPELLLRRQAGAATTSAWRFPRSASPR